MKRRNKLAGRARVALQSATAPRGPVPVSEKGLVLSMRDR